MFEEEYLAYESFDEIDSGHYVFDNPVLLKPIGQFEKDEEFDSAYVDYNSGIVALHRDIQEWTFKMNVTLSEVGDA